MRLGVVMQGTGAYAAANAGVLRLLFERGIEPYALCGMQASAWIAAVYACGGDSAQIERSLALVSRGAARFMRAQYSASTLISGRRSWLCDGRALDRRLKVELGERLLGLCERRCLFPCRLASNGRRVVFSTRAYAAGQEYELAQQATIGFAARATLACPPFLAPMPWLGSYLLPEEDTIWAAEQLLHMGADRALIIEPRAAMGRSMDALELCTARRRWNGDAPADAMIGTLRIAMPITCGALHFRSMGQLAQVGYDAARVQLDDALRELGMTQCRILPFRTRAQAIFTRR